MATELKQGKYVIYNDGSGSKYITFGIVHSLGKDVVVLRDAIIRKQVNKYDHLGDADTYSFKSKHNLFIEIEKRAKYFIPIKKSEYDQVKKIYDKLVKEERLMDNVIWDIFSTAKKLF